MKGRFESNNYPEGYEGDYYIVTDAVDEFLHEYIVEDDIAEPAIYAETIEKVAKRLGLAVELAKSLRSGELKITSTSGTGRARELLDSFADAILVEADVEAEWEEAR